MKIYIITVILLQVSRNNGQYTTGDYEMTLTTMPPPSLIDSETESVYFEIEDGGDNGEITVISFVVSELLDLSNITVCFWFSQDYTNQMAQLIKLHNFTNIVYVKVTEDKLVILNLNSSLMYTQEQPNNYSNGDWFSVCIDLSSMTLVVNGKNRSLKQDALTQGLINYIIDKDFGDSKSAISGLFGQFIGSLTNLMFFKKSLTADEIERYNNCTLTNKNEPQIMSATGNDENTLYMVKNITYPCSSSGQDSIGVMLYSVCNVSIASHVCNSLNGHMLSTENNRFDIFDDICSGLKADVNIYSWIEGTDLKCLSFICQYDHSTKQVQRGKIDLYCMPRGTMNIICLINKNSSVNVKDAENESKLKLIDYKGRLSFLNKLESKFLTLKLDEDGFQDGYYKYETMEDKCKIEIKMYDNLLGRYDCRNYKTNETKLLTISFCESHEFTCTFGNCIALDQRCDNRVHCLDESDEGSTCSTFDDLPKTYFAELCPSNYPSVKLTTRVVSLTSVDMSKNEYSLGLSIAISWVDHRLKFLNLNKNSSTTIKKKSPTIWKPMIYFNNVKYSDNINFYSPDYALAKEELRVIGNRETRIKNSYEEYEYSGQNVLITKIIEYQFTFLCEFDLTNYPFDVHICTSSFRLFDRMGCEPLWSVAEGNVILQATSAKVSMYSIERPKFFYDNVNDTANPMFMTFLISRNYNSQLLTTFGPCIALVYLGQTTILLFSLDSFNERITVTLSLLIVVASIFSQVVSTLPDSSATKFIDKFFFYCILRLSYTFVLHVFIDKSIRYINKRNDAQEKDLVTEIHKRKLKDLGDITKDVWKPGEAWGPVYIPSDSSEITKKDKKNKFANIPYNINRIGLLLGILSDIIAIIGSYYSITVTNAEKYDSFTSSDMTCLAANNTDSGY